MQHLGTLQFDEKKFDLERATIFGIFEPYGYVTWEIEIYPPGDSNHLMFSAIIIEGVFSPSQLSGQAYKGERDTHDLYQHAVRVDGEGRFLESVDMNFGNWDRTTQSIRLEGHGTIDEDDGLPAVRFRFSAMLNFTGLNLFETSRNETQEFVDNYLQEFTDHVEVKYEQAESGLHAMISGNF
ncbi:MAG TPA: hypothetical protein VKR32_19125 [Puia sp.]|nr:hypothetical protein [Puia sp.]